MSARNPKRTRESAVLRLSSRTIIACRGVLSVTALIAPKDVIMFAKNTRCSSACRKSKILFSEKIKSKKNCDDFQKS